MSYVLSFPGLVAAYVALAVLLLSLHLYSNWAWWVKLAATLALAAFYFVTYNSVPQLLGWPTPYDLPSRLYLIGIDVAEPNYIYLWARDLDQGLALSTPRAYQLPYSPSLHSKVEEAGHRLRSSLPVIVEIEGTPLLGTVAEGGEGVVSTEENIRFVDAPAGLLAPKE